LEFSCTSGAGTTTLYPTGNLGYEFRVLEVVGTGTTFVVNTGVSTIPHTYESGGVVFAPYSPGVGPITQGPYIRNCTNFVSGSIGMKVDGFDAEPGDQNDIGVTGTMSVDSYTQYNQGGIGVSITNGAYSQLVSIFTICDDIAIFTGSGGQCDITNSNSSFGRQGLVSEGVGDETTKSTDRYTAVGTTSAVRGENVVTLSGLGTFRPVEVEDLTKHKMYSDQAIINAKAAEIVNNGIKNKKRICAVGTTCMRAIESSVSTEGMLNPYSGWTNKFIYPPYDFSIANCMITNFHTPLSTLLMMISAFCGHDLMVEAYKQAVDQKYRFYSYGDAMLIL
jgi:hypothetical protein